jgi:hypothetical protein
MSQVVECGVQQVRASEFQLQDHIKNKNKGGREGREKEREKKEERKREREREREGGREGGAQGRGHIFEDEVQQKSTGRIWSLTASRGGEQLT